jgi:hypothetical protein
MRVIKEVWVLQHKIHDVEFMCAQNTTTPKLYVNEKSAKNGANYHAQYSNDSLVAYKPVKAFIVIEGDDDAIPF